MFIGPSVGVSERCFFRWLQRGKEELRHPTGKPEEQMYLQLWQTLRKAECDAVAGSVVRIRKAAQGGAVLERKTVTKTSASGEVTETQTEKYQPANALHDEWLLERMHPSEFGSDRREIRELQKQQKEIEFQLAQLKGMARVVAETVATPDATPVEKAD